MSKLNFKSQICTTKSQSEALLKLGLKKETADMAYLWYGRAEDDTPLLMDKPSIVYQGIMTTHDLPAWSLHRLIEIADTTQYINEGRDDEKELWFCMDRCYCWNNLEAFYATNLYDSLIFCIAWLIKEGYFNKEYLEE